MGSFGPGGPRMGRTPRDKNGPDTPIASAHPHKPNPVWLTIRRRSCNHRAAAEQPGPTARFSPQAYQSKENGRGCVARVRLEALRKNG